MNSSHSVFLILIETLLKITICCHVHTVDTVLFIRIKENAHNKCAYKNQVGIACSQRQKLLAS